MTDDASRAFRVLERAGWTGLSPEEVFAGARGLLAVRARVFLKHAGSRVKFTFEFGSGPDGEPLVLDDTMLVQHDDTQAAPPAPGRHVDWCPVPRGSPIEQCACPGSPIDVRERAERARRNETTGPRCAFVGLDGARCDRPTDHAGDCVLE